MRKKTAILLLAALPAAGQSLPPERALAREIYKQLIEINTTASVGDNTAAANAIAARLKAAGFPEADVKVLVPEGNAKKGNLVARLRGTGARRPLLLLAHLDVVEAKREDWSFDPFVFREQDGHFYGRGTTDDKAMAAIFVANLIRYKQEGWRPERDLILALTADEETDRTWNGVDFLVTKHRPLIDAELGLNEGGGGQVKEGKKVANTVQASEKIYQSFRLEVKNPGGHSSLPVPENAIYRLTEGLGKIARHKFPVKLNEVTRAFFTRSAANASPDEAAAMKALMANPNDAAAADKLSQRPYYNALLRTTCVATQLEAGHAENALPQLARATVNCRVLPDDSPAEVQKTLVKVLGDDKISVTPLQPPLPSPPSPLTPDVMGAVERTTQALWPGVPVVPVMSTGATDAVYLRGAGIPIYGVDGIFEDIDDIRAHGKDERLGVTAFYEGQEFLYRLVKALASSK